MSTEIAPSLHGATPLAPVDDSLTVGWIDRTYQALMFRAGASDRAPKCPEGHALTWLTELYDATDHTPAATAEPPPAATHRLGGLNVNPALRTVDMETIAHAVMEPEPDNVVSMDAYVRRRPHRPTPR